MLKDLTASNIYIVCGRTDMRKSIDGLADIMQRKYQLGELLYRQEQYWKLRGIYLNRTSLANWVIKGAKWFEPVIKMFWEYSYREPVLNADETPTRVLKKDGKPTKKKGADASVSVISIIEIAKRNNLYVYGYLLFLLTVLPKWGNSPTNEQIASVMPWSMALPTYCRQTYSEIQ